MRKHLLLGAIISFGVNLFVPAHASAEFWYRHPMPGVGSASPTSPNTAPILSGVLSSLSVEVGALINPFTSVVIADAEDDSLTVTITLDDPDKGTFSTLGGFSDRGGGSFVFEGDGPAATAAAQALVFAPSEHRLDDGESEDLSLLLVVADLAGETASGTTVLTISAPEEPQAEGGLWAWGTDVNGSLGMGINTQYHAPARVDSASDWADVFTNASLTTMAVKSDGSVWAWGDNGYGQLGLGDKTHRRVPIPSTMGTLRTVGMGMYHTVAIAADGRLFAWGSNSYGRLGLGDTSERLTPTQVGADSDWMAADAHDTVIHALKNDGTLWAWGFNSDHLGLPPGGAVLAPAQVGTDGDFTSIAVGSGSTLALKANGTIWVWGGNFNGQLGQGTSGWTGSRVPIQVGSDSDWISIHSSANSHFAIKADGSLWGWGNNQYGILGVGDTSNRSVPTRIGVDNDWAQIAGKALHVLALKRDGSLYSWGYNNNGQLGHGDTDPRYSPTRVGDELGWKAIAAGDGASLAIR